MRCAPSPPGPQASAPTPIEAENGFWCAKIISVHTIIARFPNKTPPDKPVPLYIIYELILFLFI